MLSACSQKQRDDKTVVVNQIIDTVIKHDTIVLHDQNNWQEGFGLTHNPELDSIWFKPVKFYIDNEECSPTAIDFYFGKFRPGDNRATEALLDLATTANQSLRPFYRWCLNKTIFIQDGALAEHTGIPARRYAEKYPKEFFQYMDVDTSLQKYNDWIAAIGYSGFYENEDQQSSVTVRQNLISSMIQNCKGCSVNLEDRIRKFAFDCFP